MFWRHENRVEKENSLKLTSNGVEALIVKQ